MSALKWMNAIRRIVLARDIRGVDLLYAVSARAFNQILARLLRGEAFALTPVHLLD